MARATASAHAVWLSLGGSFMGSSKGCADSNSPPGRKKRPFRARRSIKPWASTEEAQAARLQVEREKPLFLGCSVQLQTQPGELLKLGRWLSGRGDDVLKGRFGAVCFKLADEREDGVVD